MHAMIVKGGVLGVIGGLIGAAVWAGIYHFADVEIGWIAVGIGALVGFLVSFGSGEQVGLMSGMMAVVIAVACLGIGKFGGVVLDVKEITSSDSSGGFFEDYSAEDWISTMAEEDIFEREERGETVNWPDGIDPDEAWGEGEYPDDIWRDAVNRWNALSAEGQQEYRERSIGEYKAAVAEFEDYIAQEGFMASFTVWDLLWFGLAIVAAFKLGSGGGE